MKIAITGATGLIGSRLVKALKARGAEVTVLSRRPASAAASLGVDAIAWDSLREPAPNEALAGRDGVIHLAGEPVAQRWTAGAKRAILESREIGTRNLVAGIAAAEPRPGALISSSAVGYYGPRGAELIDEQSAPGSDFLAKVCVAWEREAVAAEQLGLRVVLVRTGIVLDASGGALKAMLAPFKVGVGGPIGGGKQYMSWIHGDDIVGLYLAALDNPSWRGPVNGTAPHPVTNRAFAKALGAALRRPALLPVAGFVMRARFGEMAQIITEGQRAIPAAATAGGYQFIAPELEPALASVLADGSP